MTEQTVLIAAPDLLPAMKARLASEGRDLLTFTDAEALRALEIITTRRPALVMLERKFAATPRGAALINRIKADASLIETEIEIVAHDGAPLAEPGPAPAGTHAGPTPSQAHQTPVLDYSGTRRAPRFTIGGSREITVDGTRGTLVDLSTLGAQLITQSVLKPNQRVRMSLTDDDVTIRCSATVVWASFEIPRGASPQYRAGLDFIEPDTAAIDGYIRRNKQD